MTYQVETEGGFWGALPRQAGGNIDELPPAHRQALADFFTKAKEYTALSTTRNAADITHYKITLQEKGNIQTLQVNDTQLKHLPGPLAEAVIYISNKAKSS